MPKKLITTKQKLDSEKIEIKDDCIIYYLDSNRLNGQANLKFTSSKDWNQVYYVVEKVNFKDGIYINAEKNTHIIFKNCSFYVNVSINSLGEIVFENNRYYDTKYPTLVKNFFNCNAESLKFTNEYFFNNKQKAIAENIFDMHIKTKFLFIDDSLIRIDDENGQINIEAKETLIFNSIITSPIININSDDIHICYSDIVASAKMSIENKNNSEIEGIDAPIIIYNSERIQEQKVLKI